MKKLLVLIFILVVSISTNANSKENNTNFTETNSITITDNTILLDIKDGRWKRIWKGFLGGILDGIKDGIKPIANGNDNNPYNLSKEDLLYLEGYAVKQVKSKENAVNKILQMEDLVKNDKDVILENDLMIVFDTDPRIKRIIEKILKGDRNAANNSGLSKDRKIAVKKKMMNKGLINKRGNLGKGEIIISKELPKNGRKIGYIIGFIIGKIIKNELP
jgi:hypothetical protein